MILHPGIGGWTYEYSSDFIKGNTYENVENSNANLYLKNQIIEMTPQGRNKWFCRWIYAQLSSTCCKN